MKHFFTKDQRGVGHLGVIIAVVVVLAVGGIGWWVYSQNQSKSSSNNALDEAIKNATCDYEDKDLCKFFVGWKAEKTYTITGTGEVSEKPVSIVVKVDGGDKAYLKMTGSGVNFETITIGDTTYSKAADGTWWKQTNENDSIEQYTSALDATFEEPTTTVDEDSITYKKLSKEACGDYTCFKYEAVDPNRTSEKIFVWFDDEEYKVRRMQIQAPTNTYDTTYSYEDVDIDVPSPVKELGPNQYFLPGQSEPTTLPSAGDDSTPSDEELDKLMQEYR